MVIPLYLKSSVYVEWCNNTKNGGVLAEGGVTGSESSMFVFPFDYYVLTLKFVLYPNDSIIQSQIQFPLLLVNSFNFNNITFSLTLQTLTPYIITLSCHLSSS